MNLNRKVQIWLKDGSMFKDWTLIHGDIKVGDLALDMNAFDKLDHAYLYLNDGSKIYRDRVTGSIEIQGSGMTGSLKLLIEQIEEIVPSAAGQQPS